MRTCFDAARRAAFSLLSIAACSLVAATCRADLWANTTFGSAITYGGDPNYNQVLRLDSDGDPVSGGIPGFATGMIFPTGIAVSPTTGHVFVSSGGGGKIMMFNGLTGNPLPQLEGDDPGVFTVLSNDPNPSNPEEDPAANPAQLAFGPDGNLYVSEFFGGRVRVYDPATGARLTDAATGLTVAGGLAFTADGDLLVGDGFVQTETDSARIARVHNGVVSTFGISDLVHLTAPTSVTVMPNGEVWATDVFTNTIRRFDSTGQPIGYILTPPEIPDLLPPGANYPSNSPTDIDFDPEGNVIVAMGGLTAPPDDRGAILRYDVNGNFIETIVDELQPLAGIAWTPSAATRGGDYNGDTSVGSADYAKWLSHFGRFVAQGNGADGNSNGVVDAADYVLWRSVNASGSGTIASTSVPEPASSVLILGGLFSVLASRRRRQRSQSE